MNIPRARQPLRRVNTGNYAFVAEVAGQRVLWYRTFGSYQGEWLLFSRDDDHYFLWKDWYGSCSGCDALQAAYFDRGDDGLIDIGDPEVVEFAKGYSPFLKMTVEAATRIAMDKGTLAHLLPRNRREWYDEEWANPDVGLQLALMVKGESGTITAQEILQIDNQEIRRVAIERYDPGLWVRDVDAHVLHEEGENMLYRIERPGSEEDFIFLLVKDPSTERRYVLRVPPDVRTVNAARAYTFGIPAGEFRLTEET